MHEELASLELPKPIHRSITVAHLRCAATLLRDGYCTSDEAFRLDEMVRAVSATKNHETVAEGLLRLAETYGDCPGSGIEAARGAMERGLVATDTARIRARSAERTARLCRALGDRVRSGDIEAPLLARLLDDSSLVLGTGDVPARLAALETMCVATARLVLNRDDARPTLSRAEMLQLKHVVNSVATCVFAPFNKRGPPLLVEDDVSPTDSVSSNNTDSSNNTNSRPRSLDSRINGWHDPVRVFEEMRAKRRGARLRCRRVWCASDLHVDCAANYERLLSFEAHPEDALIVAGDVATSLDVLEDALSCLRRKFKEVFFVVGNHELWLGKSRPDVRTSIDKLFKIIDLCDDLGVRTDPAFVAPELLVVPLYSWYRRFDGADHAGHLLEYFDVACKWPWPGGSLDDRTADFFMALNEGTLKWVDENARRPDDATVLSFSHFVPKVPVLFPGFVAFRHVMGCPELDAQIDRLDPRVHVFGHSHLNVDEILGSTRFVQHALGHPADGTHDLTTFAPLLVWTTPV
ncbi:hypothetical protein CTAYLR_003700 [Chrysophaeum taylorii]|uniref:Calcineurin-like phosphoesterase domain-containing protein n=1 Tax=Chrysophaeum taylorii TaxID=2483200 RepID=A0AAD7UN20_9STRA|nr:hypothetical protein CTAYLR_003700 [Chrysophaeum taylorii]